MRPASTELVASSSTSSAAEASTARATRYYFDRKYDRDRMALLEGDCHGTAMSDTLVS